MSEDKRTEFLEKKQALVDDENTVFKMNPSCEEKMIPVKATVNQQI